MNMECVNVDNNVKGLRRLMDTVETKVRGLRALGITSESYGGLFSVLIKKLPPEMRLIVSRGLTDEIVDLDSLMKILVICKGEEGRGKPIKETMEGAHSDTC